MDLGQYRLRFVKQVLYIDILVYRWFCTLYEIVLLFNHRYTNTNISMCLTQGYACKDESKRNGGNNLKMYAKYFSSKYELTNSPGLF